MVIWQGEIVAGELSMLALVSVRTDRYQAEPGLLVDGLTRWAGTGISVLPWPMDQPHETNVGRILITKQAITASHFMVIEFEGDGEAKGVIGSSTEQGARRG